MCNEEIFILIHILLSLNYFNEYYFILLEKLIRFTLF